MAKLSLTPGETLSVEKTAAVIRLRSDGVTPEQMVAALLKLGHKIEGLETTPAYLPEQFITPTPFAEQAKLSFGTPEEQSKIVNRPGLDVGDIGRQAGKVPGLVGFIAGGSAGTSVGHPNLGAATGGTAGEIVRREIGKGIGVQEGKTQKQILTEGIPAEFAKNLVAAWVAGKISKFVATKLKLGGEKIADTTIGSVKSKEVEKDILTKSTQRVAERRLDLNLRPKTTTGQEFLQRASQGELESFKNLFNDKPSSMTLQGITDKSVETLKDTGKAMDVTIKSSTKKLGEKAIQTADFPPGSYELLKQYQKSIGLSDDILETIRIGKQLSIEKTVEFYRKLFDFMPKGSWDQIDPSMSWQKEALRDLAFKTSDKVKEIVPTMGKLNKDYAFWSDIQDNAVSRLRAFQKEGLLDTSFMGFIKNVANKTITSTPIKLGTARTASRLGTGMLSKPGQLASKSLLYELGKSTLNRQEYKSTEY